MPTADPTPVLSSTISSTVTDHLLDGLNDQLRQWQDVLRAHDHVHPDRDECGGVGGCALMMAEHTLFAEQVCDRLERLTRRGTDLAVVVRVSIR